MDIKYFKNNNLFYSIILILFVLSINLFNQRRRSFKDSQIKKYDLMYQRLDEYSFVNISNIGKSVKNQDIKCIEICDSKELDIPAIRIIANIHGDETSGYRILAKFATSICLKYQEYLDGENSEDHLRINNIIKNVKFCIIPSMNPDNLFYRRRNKNNSDLNRNFSLMKSKDKLEPETRAIIDNTEMNNYVLDMDCHDGARVICFPPDQKINYDPTEIINLKYIANEYLKFNHRIKGEPVPRKFKKGYTVGSEWYSIVGSLRDYMKENYNLEGLTLELSPTKNIKNEKELERVYQENYQALLRFIELPLESFCGIITDNNNLGIEDVKIKINNNIYKTNNEGKFFIFLPTNETGYYLEISKNDYIDHNTFITTSNRKFKLQLEKK